MIYFVALIVLIVCFFYLIYKSFSHNWFFPVIIFLFGPLVVWIYVLLFWKTDWIKKILFLIVYYLSCSIVIYWVYVDIPKKMHNKLIEQQTNNAEELYEPEESITNDQEPPSESDFSPEFENSNDSSPEFEDSNDSSPEFENSNDF